MEDICKYLQPRSTLLQHNIHTAKCPFPLTCENRIPYTGCVLSDFFSKSLLGASFWHDRDTLKAAALQIPLVFLREAGTVI